MLSNSSVLGGPALFIAAYALATVFFVPGSALTWIGMMPGTVMYVYLGSVARAGVNGQQRTPAEWALYGAGLAATIAVTVIITRIARAALAKRTNVQQ